MMNLMKSPLTIISLVLLSLVGCSGFVSPGRNLPPSSILSRSGVVSTTSMSAGGGGPAVLEPPTKESETKIKEIINIDKEDKTESKSRNGKDDWEVRLWNDPFNKREFVARCLATVCGKSDTESFQIMMHAHKNGMGVIGRYQFEIAELYHNSLKEQGLMIDMIQVDDE